MSNLVSEGRVIIPNKASVFRVTEDYEPGMFVLNCASVPAKNIYASGVLGQYYLFGEDIIFSTGAPLQVEFQADAFSVIFAFKISGTKLYLWGVTNDKLIAFGQSPPARNKEFVEEDSLFSIWEVPRADVVSLTPLTNTDTHKLKDFADLLISFLKPFQHVKVRNIKQAETYAASGFEKVSWRAGLGSGLGAGLGTEEWVRGWVRSRV